ATAPPYVVRDATPAAKELGLEYGKDWVNLGYIAGGESAYYFLFLKHILTCNLGLRPIDLRPKTLNK
ncbi:unnamed protein product, partial [marine sediment metagenome]